MTKPGHSPHADVAQPKNVLLWSHRLAGNLARSTGLGRYVVELTRALVSVGDSRLLYAVGSCAEPGPPPTWVPPEVAVHRMPGSRSLVHAAWLGSPWPKIDRSMGRPDVVHVLYPSFPIRCRAPLLYTVHDLTPMTHPRWYPRLTRTGFRRSIDDACHRAEIVFTDSEHVANALCDATGLPMDRVRVAPPGVSDRFAVKRSAERQAAVLRRLELTRPYMLHVGMVAPRKNLNVLIEALASNRQLDDFDLVLAGPDQGSLDRLRSVAMRLGMADRLRPLGFVDDNDLPSLVQGARALVHPAAEEGFGFTPLEAMAAGTPAVVSDAGSLPEVVGDAAIVVHGGPDAWADALDRVMHDSTLNTELRVAGCEQAKRFTWSTTAGITAAAYREVACQD